MYQAKTGQQPPKAMRAALAAFETAQLTLLARGVANHRVLPRNLSRQQREAVLVLARRINPSL